MIKLIAGAGLMLVCFYIGINVERYYKKRLEIFKDFYEFLQYARREINFLKTDIISITNNFTLDKKGGIKKILTDIKECIKEGREVKVEDSHLNASEKSAIKGFFDSISKSDFTDQSKIFDRYLTETDDKVKLSEKQKKEKGELIKKLLILGGIALMILLI